MFIGHFAVAFAAKPAVPRTSLATLIVAAQLLDLLCALVVSHWVLDWITHRPDLQLAPGLETRIGLGLWRSPAATIAVEAAMLAVGVGLYARSWPPRDGAGTWGCWGFVAFLIVAYAAILLGRAPPRAA